MASKKGNKDGKKPDNSGDRRKGNGFVGRLSEERKEQAWRLMSAGAADNEIVRDLKMSQHTVARLRKDHPIWAAQTFINNVSDIRGKYSHMAITSTETLIETTLFACKQMQDVMEFERNRPLVKVGGRNYKVGKVTLTKNVDGGRVQMELYESITFNEAQQQFTQLLKMVSNMTGGPEANE